MRVCIITADPNVVAIIRDSLGEDAEIMAFPPQAVHPRDERLPEDDLFIEAIVSSDVILVSWDIPVTPVIGALHLRTSWSNIPVVALCVNDPQEQTMALLSGAASVTSLPLNVPLLKAMIMAHHRTRESARVMAVVQVEAEREEAGLDHGATKDQLIELDSTSYRCRVVGHEVSLTARQFALLEYLVYHEGQVVSRDELLREVWHVDFDPGSNVVEVYVHYLRNVLESHGLAGAIQTVRGRGYRYDRKKLQREEPGIHYLAAVGT